MNKYITRSDIRSNIFDVRQSGNQEKHNSGLRQSGTRKSRNQTHGSTNQNSQFRTSGIIILCCLRLGSLDQLKGCIEKWEFRMRAYLKRVGRRHRPKAPKQRRPETSASRKSLDVDDKYTICSQAMSIGYALGG